MVGQVRDAATDEPVGTFKDNDVAKPLKCQNNQVHLLMGNVSFQMDPSTNKNKTVEKIKNIYDEIVGDS